MIPKAEDEIPPAIVSLIQQLGIDWKKYNKTNLFDKIILKHWKTLVYDWSESRSLPLIIRNSRAIRGGTVKHMNGREIIFCDNSPAKWVAEQVFEKEKPSLLAIKNYLKKDQLPFKFAPAKGEQKLAKYKCVSKNLLNRRGWKLCHIEGVGLKNQKEIHLQPIDFLKRKFILLMDPNNFFILPKTIGGIGEIKWFIESQI